MPGYSLELVDLGLRFEEGLARGLRPEDGRERKKAIDEKVWATLTEREKQAFTGRCVRTNKQGKCCHWVDCERIELNAFTGPELIAFIEEGLTRHNATRKVVPPRDYLQGEMQRRLNAWFSEAIRAELWRRLSIDDLIEHVLAMPWRSERLGAAVDMWTSTPCET